MALFLLKEIFAILFVMQKKRVLVAMSGGLDSSVVACLLAKEGYEVVGAMMHYWSEEVPNPTGEKLPTNKCCSTESLFAARKVCQSIGAPFYSLNFRESFREMVVDSFLLDYKRGKTPNPCVECNRSIKFGKFFEKMRELDCDFLATGHYIRREGNRLFAGVDEKKDQSYFLFQLTEEQIPHLLFPLGNMRKTEVRELAHEFSLTEIAEKPESQGVCFFPEGSVEPFLRRNASELFAPGEIVTKEGKVIGEHNGLPKFTIGQRKGIEIGGEHDPWVVIGFDYAKNRLIVGKDEDLWKNRIDAMNLSWISGIAPKNDGIKRFARIRHLGKLHEISDFAIEKNRLSLHLKEPIRAVTRGQSVVIYSAEAELLGGGEIV